VPKFQALIVEVSEASWPATRKRIEEWDELRLSPPDNDGRKT
jgi:hypothetical protein